MDTPAAEAIEAIRALIAGPSTPYEILVQKAHALMALAPLSIGSILEPGLELYRGTNYHIAVPMSQHELSYPPVSCVASFGRANRPGKPLFYCSPDSDGVFRELRSRVGQYAVLAKWVTTRRAILHGIGYVPLVFQRANARRGVPDPYRELDARIDDIAGAIRQFLAMEFTAPGDENYRFTAAVAEMLMAGDDFAGIVYPTVAKNCNADNVALLPAFVDSGLRLVEAQVVMIDEISSEGSIGGQVVARLAAVNAGQLAWKYTGESSTRIPPSSAAVVRMPSGHKSRAEQTGTVVIDGSTYELLPGYSIEVVEGEVLVRDLQSTRVKPIASSPRPMSNWPEAYGENLNEYLRRFDRLFATATAIAEIDGVQIAVSVCYRVVLSISGERWTIEMKDGIGIEMHDPRIAADRIAWSAYIHNIFNTDGPAKIRRHHR